MGMFRDVMNKIFNPGGAAARAEAPRSAGPGGTAPAPPDVRSAGASPATQTAAPVDVAAILDKMASESKQKLDLEALPSSA